MSAGHSASSARAVVSWSGPIEEGLAHVGDVEQARRSRASTGARPGCRSGTAPACRSRRTAPCGRRARRWRAWSGVSQKRGRRRLSAGEMAGARARRSVLAASAMQVPGQSSTVPALRPVRAPSVPDLRDFPRASPGETRRLPPSVGTPRLSRTRRFPERQLPAVLWPERFRGGCAFGAGDWPLRDPAGLFRGDHWLIGVREGAALSMRLSHRSDRMCAAFGPQATCTSFRGARAREAGRQAFVAGRRRLRPRGRCAIESDDEGQLRAVWRAPGSMRLLDHDEQVAWASCPAGMVTLRRAASVTTRRPCRRA